VTNNLCSFFSFRYHFSPVFYWNLRNDVTKATFRTPSIIDVLKNQYVSYRIFYFFSPSLWIFMQKKANTVDRQGQPAILNSLKFSSISICAVKRHYIAILTASNTKRHCCLLQTNSFLNIASLLGCDVCSLVRCLYCSCVPMHTASYD